MKPAYLFLLFLLLVSYSCKPAKENRQDGKLLVITPVEPSNFVTDLIPYIDTIIANPLETTPLSLISTVRKILVRPNGDLIISTLSDLLVFNKEGKYLYTLGKKGRGPEEYLSVQDICLSQDNKILHILTTTEEVVSYHAETGAFIRKIVPRYPQTKTNKSAIASGPAGTFFIHTDFPTYDNQPASTGNLLLFDTQGELLKSYPFLKTQPVDMMALITQRYDNQYILRPQNSDNICIYLSDSLPDPRMKIDFGKKSLPSEFSRDLQTYLRSDYYKMPIDIHETARQLFFTFCGPEAREYYSVYSFPSRKSITWKRTGNDDTALFRILGADREYFYGIYNDYRDSAELSSIDCDLLKKAVIQKTGIELKEDSNPALVKIKFRY